VQNRSFSQNYKCEKLIPLGQELAPVPYRTEETMNITIKRELNDVNWEELALIFGRAQLGKRDPEKLQREPNEQGGLVGQEP
jgi:hypothetical protein